MSEQKRKLAETDPDYEDGVEQEAKRQRVLEQDGRDTACKKITTIIKKEFQKEITEKEKELQQIDLRLNQARLMMDRLRACVVASYYGRANRNISSVPPSSNISSLKAPPPNIHPAVKKYLGKCPKDSGFAKTSTQSGGTDDNDRERDDNVEKAMYTQRCSSPAQRLLTSKTSKPSSSMISGSTTYDDRRSRFKVKKKIVIGNVSRYIPVDQRESTDMSSHKWMVYVRGPKSEPDVSHFVKKVWFFLHHSYKPNDHVEISVPPFHLTRRGWGEFPVRVQLHFVDSRNKKVDIIHHLKLDKTFTGLQKLGAETVVEVELEKDYFETDDDIEVPQASSLPELYNPNPRYPAAAASLSSTSSTRLASPLTLASQKAIPSSTSSSLLSLSQLDPSSSSSNSSLIRNESNTELSETHSNIGSKSKNLETNEPFAHKNKFREKGKVESKTEIYLQDALTVKEEVEMEHDSRDVNRCYDKSQSSFPGSVESLGELDVEVDDASSGVGRVGDEYNVTIKHEEVLECKAEKEMSFELSGARTVNDMGYVNGLMDEGAEGNNEMVIEEVVDAGWNIPDTGNIDYNDVGDGQSVVAGSGGIKIEVMEEDPQPRDIKTENNIHCVVTQTERHHHHVVSNVSSSSSSSSSSLSSLNTKSVLISPKLIQASPVTAIERKLVAINNSIDNQSDPNIQRQKVSLLTSSTLNKIKQQQKDCIQLVHQQHSQGLQAPHANQATIKQSFTSTNQNEKCSADVKQFTVINFADLQKSKTSTVSSSNPQMISLIPKPSLPQPNTVVNTITNGPRQIQLTQIRPQVVQTVKGKPNVSQQNPQLGQKVIYLKPSSSKSSSPSISSPLLSMSSSLPSSSPVSVVTQNPTTKAVPLANKGKKQISLLTGLVINSTKQPTSQSDGSHITATTQQVPSLHKHTNISTFTAQGKPESSVAANSLLNLKIGKISSKSELPQQFLTSQLTPDHKGQVVSSKLNTPHSVTNRNVTTLSLSSSSSSSTLITPATPKSLLNLHTPSNTYLSATSSPNIIIAYPNTNSTLKSVNVNNPANDFVVGEVKMSAIGKTKYRNLRLVENPSLTQNETEERIRKQFSVLNDYKKNVLDYKLLPKTFNDEIDGQVEIIPRLNTEEYPDVYSLTKAAVRLHPLVQSDVNKLTHPYCAQSRDQWMSWPIGKRRASEWHRACFTLKYLRDCLGGGNSFKGESLMSTRQLVQWSRLHAFSPQLPVYPTPDSGMDNDRMTASDDLSEDRITTVSMATVIPQSFTHVTDLSARLSSLSQASDGLFDAEEVEIVLEEPGSGKINVKEEVTSVKREDEEEDVGLELPPLTYGALFVHDWMRKRGVRFLQEDNADERTAADGLFQTVMEFGSDILRRSFSMYSQRDRSQSDSLTVGDVHKALCSFPAAAFCRNSYLGKEEGEEEGSGGSGGGGEGGGRR